MWFSEREVQGAQFMTIQEAIDKAIEGGYYIHGSDGMDTYYEGANSDFSAWTRKDNESSFMVPTEETLLDPQFWQALGRALGWSEMCDLSITCVHGHEECRQYHGYYWMFQWHCFIQALADGNTPDASFAHLTSSQTRSGGTKHRHQAGKAHLHRSFLFLLAEATCQHAQHICEEAAVLQECAKDLVQRKRLARHRRRGA
jgi:hypothetical protein